MRHLLAFGVPESTGLLAWLRTVWSGIVAPHRVAARQSGDAAWRPCHSVSVLVVDDNPVNLMMISASMMQRGLVPLLASDGAEAVALACELHFDLILMDLQMPILDGTDATVAIRQFETAHARPAVPVIAYSAAPPAAEVLAGFGMNGSLAKPCDDQQLEDCLVRWCPSYRQAANERSAALHADALRAGAHRVARS
jgi:CheY-like chemotaxis protein